MEGPVPEARGGSGGEESCDRRKVHCRQIRRYFNEASPESRLIGPKLLSQLLRSDVICGLRENEKSMIAGG